MKMKIMSQEENHRRIRNINDYLVEIIDKSKSFEEQIKSIRKIKNLKERHYMEKYVDKKLEFKIFKLRFHTC